MGEAAMAAKQNAWAQAKVLVEARLGDAVAVLAKNKRSGVYAPMKVETIVRRVFGKYELAGTGMEYPIARTMRELLSGHKNVKVVSGRTYDAMYVYVSDEEIKAKAAAKAERAKLSDEAEAAIDAWVAQHLVSEVKGDLGGPRRFEWSGDGGTFLFDLGHIVKNHGCGPVNEYRVSFGQTVYMASLDGLVDLLNAALNLKLVIREVQV
jgi:hypothetical protein